MWLRVTPLALLSAYYTVLYSSGLCRQPTPSSGCLCWCHQISVNLWISWRVECWQSWQILPTTRHLQPCIHSHRHQESGGSPEHTLMLPRAWLLHCPDLVPCSVCVPIKPVLRLNQDYRVITDRECSRRNCKNLPASKIQLLFSLCAPDRTDSEQHLPKEISCIPLKSRGQERFN